MAQKSKIPISIWAIGLATFLTNLSTVIIFGYSAVYLNAILGVSTGLVGFLEGVVEASAYLIKLFSGVLSDYYKKRKPWVVLGFTLSAISRPILAIFSSFGGVFFARLLDRFGNGFQATPRDALVGDLAPNDIKGSCFGLRQSLATAGSFAGGIVGIILMELTDKNYQLVFAIAAIPTILAVLVLIFFVHEKKKSKSTIKKEEDKAIKEHVRRPIRFSDVPRLGSAYWGLMVVVGLFMMARVGEAFLLLHAKNNFGLSESYVPIILMLYNGANALISYPVGRFSDNVDRKKLLIAGFVALVTADLCLGLATNFYVMMVGVVIWGIQIGITQSMSLALISDFAPKELRGTAIGIYYLVSAFSLFIAGAVGGSIADKFGLSQMFMVSACVGAFALFALLLFTKKVNKES